MSVLHVTSVAVDTPHLPRRRWTLLVRTAISSAAHLAAVSMVLVLAKAAVTPAVVVQRNGPSAPPIDTSRIVFIADPLRIGGGGGGGGNRQTGPIRHAEGVGSDALTLRVRHPVSTAGVAADVAPLAAVVLDAKPLASGTFDQVGLPTGGVGYGSSTGPGSGGGVGTGTGTGIGPGRGPGVGPGSDGGTGGGVYRPGGAVTSPRVLVQVKPTYTTEALQNKVQGTVVLELVVTRDGQPSQIRVIRSLDSALDRQAVSAAAQWRFAPGRLAGVPVDVLVTMMMDFSIR